MKKTGYFDGSDGHSKIYYSIWEPEGEIKGILQILHGMTEYVDRYEPMAEYFNSLGILVAGEDHIGHGHSSQPGDYGYFGKKDGWLHMLGDVNKLHGILAEKYPGVPMLMLGHSMGSFILRCCLAKYKPVDLCGAIIVGTSGTNPSVGAGIGLASLLRAIKGGRSKSLLLTTVIFGSYNRHIHNPRSGKDWLTSDEEVISKYLSDPMAGFVFSIGGYIDMLRMVQFMNSAEFYENYPKDLATIIMSGTEDPVGDYGKGPREVYERLVSSGCKRAELKLYDGMRHEIHNEIGKERVLEDMKEFIFGCI